MTGSSLEITLCAVLSLIRRLARNGDLPAVLATAPLETSTRLEQLGLDSVGKVNLLLAIDEELGIYIPDDTLSPEMTLKALVELVAGRRRY